MTLPTPKNRVGQAVSSVADAGLGTITLGSAESGYAALVAGDDTKYFDYVAIEGTAWEVVREGLYTHSGPTLTRGTTEASSSGGSKVTLTSAAKVYVTQTAERINRAIKITEAVIPGGRLTLTSGTPVTTSDVTGATSVYYTPYVHDIIVLWDGANWVPVQFTEKSHALGTVTSGRPYDVFGYLSSGDLALEKQAWDSDTARNASHLVTLQDGRYCKSGDKTRLLLGTFYTTSTTATADSGAMTATVPYRYLWNAYNRVTKPLCVKSSANTWTCTNTSFENADAAGADNMKVNIMSGLAVSQLQLAYICVASQDTTNANNAIIAFNEDGSLMSDIGPNYVMYTAIAAVTAVQGQTRFIKVPATGRHIYQARQKVSGGTTTFYSDNSGAADYRTGIVGSFEC